MVGITNTADVDYMMPITDIAMIGHFVFSAAEPVGKRADEECATERRGEGREKV
jgi:hypothetical protein